MQHRTVQDALVAIAEEAGADSAEFLRTWTGSHINSSLPERYQRLVTEVVFRLPAEWDANVEWSAGLDLKQNPSCYGSALRQEETEEDYADAIQVWEISLYPNLLDRLSDAACRWMIAHEFGHVASGLPTGSITIAGIPLTRVRGAVDCYVEVPIKDDHEDAANGIALKWGFKTEREAFITED